MVRGIMVGKQVNQYCVNIVDFAAYVPPHWANVSSAECDF